MLLMVCCLLIRANVSVLAKNPLKSLDTLEVAFLFIHDQIPPQDLIHQRHLLAVGVTDCVKHDLRD